MLNLFCLFYFISLFFIYFFVLLLIFIVTTESSYGPLLMTEVVQGATLISLVSHKIRLPRMSHRWRTVPPTDHTLRLTDQDYRWNARYRLGSPITGVTDLTKCPACNKHQAFQADPWHYLPCSTLISKYGTARHNAVAIYLTIAAQTGGCNAIHVIAMKNIESVPTSNFAHCLSQLLPM